MSFTTSGAQALEAVDKEPPDMILLDIAMSEMDGFEVCRKLKESDEYSHIPVVFITAHDDADKIENAFAVAAVDIVTKPVCNQEIGAALRLI